MEAAVDKKENGTSTMGPDQESLTETVGESFHPKLKEHSPDQEALAESKTIEEELEEPPPLVEDYSVSSSVEDELVSTVSALSIESPRQNNSDESPRAIVVFADKQGSTIPPDNSTPTPKNAIQKQLRFEGIGDDQLDPLSTPSTSSIPDPPQRKKPGISNPSSRAITRTRSTKVVPETNHGIISSSLYTVCQCMSEWVFGGTFSEAPSDGSSTVPSSAVQRQHRRFLKQKRHQRYARRMALADIFFSWARSVPVLPPRLPSSDQDEEISESREEGVENDLVPLFLSNQNDAIPRKDHSKCKRSTPPIIPSSIEVTKSLLMDKTETSIRVNPDLMYTTPGGATGNEDTSSEASTASSSSTISSCVGCPICNKSLFPPPHQIQQLEGGRVVLPLRQQFFHCPQCQQRMHSHCAVQLLEHLNHQKCPCCRQAMVSKVLLHKTIQQFHEEASNRSGASASSTIC